jgi:hypothetical protein
MISKTKKVALISNDKIGSKMAGPGIRYLELARSLSKHFEVTLFTPDFCDIELDFCKVVVYIPKHITQSVGKQIGHFDYVISQNLRPSFINIMKRNKVRFIADLYDPLPIEIIEYNKYSC